MRANFSFGQIAYVFTFRCVAANARGNALWTTHGIPSYSNSQRVITNAQSNAFQRLSLFPSLSSSFRVMTHARVNGSWNTRPSPAPKWCNDHAPVCACGKVGLVVADSLVVVSHRGICPPHTPDRSGRCDQLMSMGSFRATPKRRLSPAPRVDHPRPYNRDPRTMGVGVIDTQKPQ